MIAMLSETDLVCINNKDEEGAEFTHIDRSSNTSNVLDYVLTNNPNLVTSMSIDTKFKKTPHYLRLRGGQTETAYSDHHVGSSC